MGSKLLSEKRWLGPIAIFLTATMAIACLWPIRAPRNNAAWLPDGSGIALRSPSSLISATAFDPGPGEHYSIELWLQSRATRQSGVILAFYDRRARTGFSIAQAISDLTMSWERPTDRESVSYFNGVFGTATPQLLTISSGPGGTSVYRNTQLTECHSEVKLKQSDLRGRLVIGDSPRAHESWTGTVKGIAVFDKTLTREEIAEHLAYWREGHPRSDMNSMKALYTFRERGGNTVRDLTGNGPALAIPARYTLMDQVMLEPASREYHATWAYFTDVAVNIIGFVPFGVCVQAYLTYARKTRHAVASTIVLSAALSLAIEVSQSLIPTRYSGITDVCTNTLGGALGALWLRYFPNTQRISTT